MTSQNGDMLLDRPVVSFEKGETYKAMGLLREAICEYQRALSEESLRHKSTRRMAECLIALKRVDQAEKVLLQVLLSANVPKEDRLHIYSDLAELYLSQGRIESALERLMQIRREDDKIFPDLLQRIEEVQKMIGYPASELPDMIASEHSDRAQSSNAPAAPASPVDRSTSEVLRPSKKSPKSQTCHKRSVFFQSGYLVHRLLVRPEHRRNVHPHP